MSLYEDMKLALAPIVGMRERLTSFEQQVFDDALADVEALCDGEDEQAKITAEMMLELEAEADNAGGSRPDDSPPMPTPPNHHRSAG